MSVNSSSSFNESVLYPNFSHIHNFPSAVNCVYFEPGHSIFISSIITNLLLLLPVCILVLYLGLQRWQQQRSTFTAVMTSHSDSFTYHMVIMKLFSVLGYILICCGFYEKHKNASWAGFRLVSLTWYGDIFFHILTCVEHYLAVIHPIIYLTLKGERGVRIRNISIGCVWLLSIGGTSLKILQQFTFIVGFCIVTVALIVICFCSLAVLCALIRPGPGEQAGERKWVDQSKRRAFYTIVVILGVLLLRFCWTMAWVVPTVVTGRVDCLMQVSEFWLNLPCSLVLPLMFLHRAGRLACCKNTIK